MQQRRTRIWLGLSTSILVGASGVAAADEQTSAAAGGQEADQPMLLAGHHGGEGGEASAGGEGGEASAGGEGGEASAGSEGGEASAGGEGGEGGSSGLGAEQQLTVNLLLMQGHMRVGRELVEQGAWDDAYVHFEHPLEELYGQVEPALERQGAEPFDARLEQLADVVEHRQQDRFEAAFHEAGAAIDAVLNQADGQRLDDVDFMLPVLLSVLRTAGDEYAAAVNDGRIVNVAEYQDSRGFVWTVAEQLNRLADRFKAIDAEATGRLMAQLAELQQAWPSASPPDRAVAPTQSVYGTVARIEFTASELR